MNNAGDGDDEKADDDGGDSNVESVPAQPPGPIVVTIIITFSRLRIRNHFYMQNSVNTFEDFKNRNNNKSAKDVISPRKKRKLIKAFLLKLTKFWKL